MWKPHRNASHVAGLTQREHLRCVLERYRGDKNSEDKEDGRPESMHEPLRGSWKAADKNVHPKVLVAPSDNRCPKKRHPNHNINLDFIRPKKRITEGVPSDDVHEIHTDSEHKSDRQEKLNRPWQYVEYFIEHGTDDRDL
jgi:hypothetical protein